MPGSRGARSGVKACANIFCMAPLAVATSNSMRCAPGSGACACAATESTPAASASRAMSGATRPLYRAEPVRRIASAIGIS